MKVSCPHCRTVYEIDMTLIPEDGRDVQCANCQTVWHLSQSEPLLLMDVVKSPGQFEPVAGARSNARPTLAYDSQDMIPANQTARLEDRLAMLESLLAPVDKEDGAPIDIAAVEVTQDTIVGEEASEEAAPISEVVEDTADVVAGQDAADEGELAEEVSTLETVADASEDEDAQIAEAENMSAAEAVDAEADQSAEAELDDQETHAEEDAEVQPNVPEEVLANEGDAVADDDGAHSENAEAKTVASYLEQHEVILAKHPEVLGAMAIEFDNEFDVVEDVTVSEFEAASQEASESAAEIVPEETDDATEQADIVEVVEFEAIEVEGEAVGEETPVEIEAASTEIEVETDEGEDANEDVVEAATEDVVAQDDVVEDNPIEEAAEAEMEAVGSEVEATREVTADEVNEAETEEAVEAEIEEVVAAEASNVVVNFKGRDKPADVSELATETDEVTFEAASEAEPEISQEGKVIAPELDDMDADDENEEPSEDELFVAQAVERLSSRSKLGDQVVDTKSEIEGGEFKGEVISETPLFAPPMDRAKLRGDQGVASDKGAVTTEEAQPHDFEVENIGTAPAKIAKSKKTRLTQPPVSPIEREIQQDKNLREESNQEKTEAKPVVSEPQPKPVEERAVAKAKKQPQILPRQDTSENSAVQSDAKTSRTSRETTNKNAVEIEAETQRSIDTPKLTKNQVEIIENDPTTKKLEVEPEIVPPQKKAPFVSSFWTGFLFTVTMIVVFASLRYLADPISELFPFSEQIMSDYSNVVDQGVDKVSQIFT